jgi:HEAT repeat protein
MYSDPSLPGPRVESALPEGAVKLWSEALSRPEVHMRASAAGAIAQARRRGLAGVEAAAGPLRTALERKDEHPAVRLAVARALVALDAKAAAPGLLAAVRNDAGLREVVEPALARWDHRPARADWLERLRNPQTPPRSLVLAIEALQTVREEAAAARLGELARSAEPVSVRLAAARALGWVQPAGLEEEAAKLAADRSPRGLTGRLVAGWLLRHHKGDAAVRLMQEAVKGPEPAVAALAAARLSEIDRKLLLPALSGLLTSSDANLRSYGVDVLFRVKEAPQRVGQLADRLDDPAPAVRRQARQALVELGAEPTLRPAVIAAGMRLLGGLSWRGQEQAAILLVRLDHKEAAPRLVELVRANRPEAFVTAAWALRKLAVPATLPALVRYAREEQPRLRNDEVLPGREGALVWVGFQVSQINQFVGQQKYQDADPVLREFIPRAKGLTGAAMHEARAAAIWALGLLHEGKNDPGLAQQLEARFNDTQSRPPEDERVIRMSAITLGRLKAKGALGSLRKTSRSVLAPIGRAAAWSVWQMTGEPMPKVPRIRRTYLDWFLVPARKDVLVP